MGRAMGAPTRSPGTDTLLRVFAWCLSPSELGQAPSGTTEPVPEQYVEAARGEPARLAALTALPGLSQRRIGGCSRSVHG
jgi:hypothetical protein